MDDGSLSTVKIGLRRLILMREPLPRERKQTLTPKSCD
jgi:hypothetical protein